jgi:hypothetical protein
VIEEGARSLLRIVDFADQVHGLLVFADVPELAGA